MTSRKHGPIRRKRRTPLKLQSLSRAHDMTPEEFLRNRLEAYPTFKEAADALGIDHKTLWRWRRQYELEVA